MKQALEKPLAISVTCPTTVEIDDVLVLSDDLTAAAISSEASPMLLGTVVSHTDGEATCTVATRFRERRDDREASSAVALGPYVWGATGEATSYTAQVYAVVTGTQTGPFVIVAAAAGTHTGSTTGNKTYVAAAAGTHTGTTTGVHTFVVDTSDKVKVKVGAGASQTVTITAGVDVTMATVATEINAQTTDLTASVDGTGHLVLTADLVTDALEVEAVANDAYTLLGLTAAVYAVTAPVDKVKVKIGAGVSQTVTLTPGLRTMAQVATDINAQTTDLTASVDVDGHLVLTADLVTDRLEVEAVTGDAYTETGLTAAVYAITAPLDKVKLTIGSGVAQTFTLTPGSRTIAQIVTDLAALTGATASSASGYLRITSTDLQDSIVVGAVTGDAYTALGLTAATTTPTARSHDPYAIAGFVISRPDPCEVICDTRGPFLITNGSTDAVKLKIGAGGSQTFDLTAGAARTATEIAADFNATGSDFTAVALSGQRVQILADDPWNDIEIEAVANDAYDILGLTVGVTSAPTTIQTLEY